MLENLIKIIELVNKGEIRTAAKEVIELAKNDEENLEIVAELEKILKDLETGDYLKVDDSFPFNEELKTSYNELKSNEEKLLKFLTIYAVYKLSNGNVLLMNMINKIEIKPHTYF